MRLTRPGGVADRSRGRYGCHNPVATAPLPRGQTVSNRSRSGNRPIGSSVTLLDGAAPDVQLRLEGPADLNQTSTGQVTTAVTLSAIRLLRIGLIGSPRAANRTSGTTCDGISPSSRTVTVVRFPAVPGEIDASVTALRVPRA